MNNPNPGITAAPLFVMGSRVKGGLHGSAPSLQLKRNEDLTFSTDFRQVYAAVLDRWLNCPSEHVLGGKFRGVLALHGPEALHMPVKRCVRRMLSVLHPRPYSRSAMRDDEAGLPTRRRTRVMCDASAADS